MDLSRRHFLRNAGAVGLGFVGLRELLARGVPSRGAGYGDLVADPQKALDLPKGFAYRVLGRAGDRMDDGLLVPGLHDGMAAFPGPDGRTLLVRNHEVGVKGNKESAFGARLDLLGKVPPAKLYDAGGGTIPGGGGTTTLVFDTKAGRLELQFLSLAGTIRNCAGGPTPWGSWLSCEETVERAGKGLEKDHGYVFEVPARAEIGLADPVPLKAMGRMYHEAVAIDPKTGIAYLTEDKSDGLFYRFLPNAPGKFAEGGKLQALAVRGKPSLNTSNQGKGDPLGPGEALEVEWIDMDDVESPKDDLRKRGKEKGAAVFSRGEGMWYGREAVYFACTSGGRNKKGQIFRYLPGPNRLELFVEPNDPNLLENADNMTIAPWGDLLVCENGKAPNQVVGVTPEGKLYTLARNTANSSELAGVCVSPDGSTVFVNVQKPGWTLAITGPWQG
jgi:hypothetical protein